MLLPALLFVAMEPSPTPIPANVPPCASTQLRAAALGGQADGSRRSLLVAITNGSTKTCSVAGFPDVSLQYSANRPDPVTTATAFADPLWTAPPARTIVLGSNAQASFYLGYIAVDAKGANCTPGTFLVISGFADRVAIRLPISIAPCTGLTVSPFQEGVAGVRNG